MSDIELKAPDSRLTVTYRGEQRELFMSFLRMNSCLRMLGEPERLSVMLLDPDTCELMLRVVLAEKGQTGRDVELQDDDLSDEDVDRILLWVQEHLTYFFMKRFQQLGDKTRALEPIAQRLKSSLVGSEVSSSSEPSAGPST